MGKSLSLSLSLLSFFSFIPLYFSFLLSAPPLLAVFLYLTPTLFPSLPLSLSLLSIFLSLSHSTSLSFSLSSLSFFLSSLSFFISLYLSFSLSLLSFFLYLTLPLFHSLSPLFLSLCHSSSLSSTNLSISHTHTHNRFFSLPFPSLSPSLFPPSLIN